MKVGVVSAEAPDTTILKIKERKLLFQQAGVCFDVNWEYLSAIVFVERALFYDWTDDALDIILARAGRNSSIGFCQVKIKTAYWIEKQLNDPFSKFYPGEKYRNILKVSESPEELIYKLKNDTLNIYYASAYLRIIQSYWEKAGFPIDNRPDILGTLYSTGLFYRDRRIRKPNKDPKSNEFGKLVLQYLNSFHLIKRNEK
ncbi:MAG: hypothetical protein U9R01_07950 [candidate division WOR-3 bacterium]|nr:hypothetical protein [candidate division WOR-3 bacterium]